MTTDGIVRLAREASIELNVADVKDLATSSEFLPRGTRMYVSHLPKQSWNETVDACSAVRIAGFNPIPHIPVRLLSTVAALDELIRRLIDEAGVTEALLIAGDYPSPVGPFSEVAQALRACRFADLGIKSVSLAGHPEGHPKVSLDVIRAAEREKIAIALRAGLQVTMLTQFFFEADPFLRWSDTLYDYRAAIRIVAGIAGPTKTASLFKFALRCGVGPSMRAVVAHPSSMMKLARDHGPERLLRDLSASLTAEQRFSGVHFFGFGGFLRTCVWLRKIVDGRIRLTETAFEVIA